MLTFTSISTLLLTSLAIGSQPEPASKSHEFRPPEGLIVMVRDAAGAALPGATLALHRRGEDGLLECEDWKQAEAVRIADDQGRGTFLLVQPGDYCLRVSLEVFVALVAGPFTIDSFENPRQSVEVPFVLVLPVRVQSG